eukprot:360627-Chlamydomonas_euryale.AAC.1
MAASFQPGRLSLMRLRLCERNCFRMGFGDAVPGRLCHQQGMTCFGRGSAEEDLDSGGRSGQEKPSIWAWTCPGVDRLGRSA